MTDMDMMTLDEAIAVVTGVVRFQRAMGRINEVLETAKAAETLIGKLAKQKEEMDAEITAKEQRLAEIDRTLNARQPLLDEALADIAVKANAEYDLLVKAKKEEINRLEQRCIDLQKNISIAQDGLQGLKNKQDQARADIEVTKRVLEEIKQQKAELVAKLS
jgi:chromosome segregation ATPase